MKVSWSPTNWLERRHLRKETRLALHSEVEHLYRALLCALDQEGGDSQIRVWYFPQPRVMTMVERLSEGSVRDFMGPEFSRWARQLAGLTYPGNGSMQARIIALLEQLSGPLRRVPNFATRRLVRNILRHPNIAAYRNTRLPGLSRTGSLRGWTT